MREALLLVKATRSLGDKSLKLSRKFFSGMLIFLMLLNILMSVIIHDKDCAAIVINFVNTLNFSTFYVIANGFIIRNRSEVSKVDFIKFAVQIPVNKKSIGLSKFIQIWIGFIPLFIIIICQNISCYLKSMEGLQGYIGLCTILMCSQFIVLSLIAGFNPFLAHKSNISRLFTFLYLVIICISLVIIFGNIVLNNEEIYYGMFGARFTGLFEKLEFFSGTTGGVVSILSICLGYLLSYYIPNKIYGREGWNV